MPDFYQLSLRNPSCRLKKGILPLQISKDPCEIVNVSYCIISGMQKWRPLYCCWFQAPDICKCLVVFLFIRTAAAKFKNRVSRRMYSFGGNLQHFQPNGINCLLSHIRSQCQTSEPVEEIICHCMDTKEVCVNDFRMAADRGKIKSAFSFFDEVLHFAAAAIETDHLPGLHFHCSDDEGKQVYKLICWFFNLEDDSPRM